MKITEYVRIIKGHTKTDLRHLHGDKFYDAWDDIYGLFNTELLQLGRYALAVQTPETGNNMVSRNTTPKNDIYAKTSRVYHFSPEKTRGAEETISNPSVPQLLDQGGFNPFLPPLTPLPTLIPPNDTACKLAPGTYQQNLGILDSWYGRSETLRGASNDKARIDHSGQPPIFFVPVALTVERRICNAEALGSNPNGHIVEKANRLDYNLKLFAKSREWLGRGCRAQDGSHCPHYARGA